MSNEIPAACPKCGCTFAYTKERAYGSVRLEYMLDKAEACDAGSMYDGLRFKGGKWLYCLNCNYKLGEAMPWVKDAHINADRRSYR